MYNVESYHLWKESQTMALIFVLNNLYSHSPVSGSKFPSFHLSCYTAIVVGSASNNKNNNNNTNKMGIYSDFYEYFKEHICEVVKKIY